MMVPDKIAQAFSIVPIGRKMRGAHEPLHLRQTDERDRNSCVISWVNRRSRFLEKVEASNTLSSVESPTDQ
jgi:hypothetical protein